MPKKSIIITAVIILAFLFSLAGCGSDSSSPSIPTATPSSPTATPVSTISHGPRIGLVIKDSATISWDTGTEVICELKYGKSDIYTDSRKETVASTRHSITLTNLSADTNYHYKIIAGNDSSSDHNFTTAPGSDKNFTFVSMADNRGVNMQADLVNLPVAFTKIINLIIQRKPSFVINCGDLFVATGTPGATLEQLRLLYESFKRATDPLAGDTSYLISPGNHEMGITGIDTLAIFNEELPQPDQLQNFKGTCYSWDWGNTHLASIDSCRFDPNMYPDQPAKGIGYLSDTEINWLDNDLKDAQARKVRHLIVFSHINGYANNDPNYPTYYNSDPNFSEAGNLGTFPTQRDKFWAVLQKYKIDAYICGHQHETVIKNINGVLHWCNGNSGSGSADGNNEWTLWTINGDNITADLYNEYGVKKYTQNITSQQP